MSCARRLPLIPSPGLLVLLLMALVPVALPASLTSVERVSVPYAGGTDAGGGTASHLPCISADGRYVAFESGSESLVPGDRNSYVDVFVRDRVIGTTERVSVSSSGAEALGGSTGPAISADGRYVVFRSTAELAPPLPGSSTLFLRDRLLGTTERVPISGTGAPMFREPSLRAISVDGRFILFGHLDNGIVPGDTNNSWDLFVRDRQTQTTERVSLAWNGTQGFGHSRAGSISNDGRFVAFGSEAENLVPDDTNNREDYFVRDRLLGITERVNLSSSGEQANEHSLGGAVISDDGRFVAFDSRAPNLTGASLNNVYVRDRLARTTELISQADGVEGGGDSPSISADGRFVAFRSSGPNLTPDGNNGRTQVFIVDRARRSLTRVSSVPDGSPGDSSSGAPIVSRDGGTVTFGSSASNLTPGQTLGFEDVFVATIEQPSAPQPAAPTDLTASAVSATQITLRWHDNANDETGFELQRVIGTAFTSGSSVQSIAVPARPATGITTYTDTALTTNSTYTYRVRALGTGQLTSAYSNEATARPETQLASVEVVSAGMVSQHVFRVSTKHTAGAPASLQVTVPFPGAPVTATETVTAGSASRTFDFDLAALRVPRFTVSLALDVTARLVASGVDPVASTVTTRILLPIVTVHGIKLSPSSGRFPELQQFLVTNSRQWGALGAYQIYQEGASTPYPTIYSFQWTSNTALLSVAAVALMKYIKNTVLTNTWAAKVILIGHSRGANLTRYFLTQTATIYCSGALLACMPATGAVDASLIPAGPATDLNPTWPWHRGRPGQPFSVSPPNQTLTALNSKQRPPMDIVALYGVTDGKKDTPNTLTTLPRRYSWVSGDGVVTTNSAQGVNITAPDKNNPDLFRSQPPVKWMTGVEVQSFSFPPASGFLHNRFLAQPKVQHFVFDWLTVRTLRAQ
jgi:Tol biopolymer transport system component